MSKSSPTNRPIVIASFVEVIDVDVDGFDAEAHMSDNEKARDCATLAAERRLEADQASDPQHKQWALQQARAEQAQAAQFKLRTHQHGTRHSAACLPFVAGRTARAGAPGTE